MIIRFKHKVSNYDIYKTIDIDLNFYNPYVVFKQYNGLMIYRNIRQNKYKKGAPITTLLLVDDSEIKIIDGNKVTVLTGLLTLFALANYIG